MNNKKTGNTNVRLFCRELVIEWNNLINIKKLHPVEWEVYLNNKLQDLYDNYDLTNEQVAMIYHTTEILNK